MSNFFLAPTGTVDFLPEYHNYFTFVKKVIRHRFRQSGFRRISTPMFEETKLFLKSLGANNAITARELYSFEDRKKREFTLRPEITSGVVRSFIEKELHKGPLPVEWYYIEPCFRFERPNSRTNRQFWQFGAEILGESDPSIDAQMIYMGHRILTDLGIRDLCELKINTIGSMTDRKDFFEALANFYAGKERSLSPESQEKLKQGNYLELLEARNEDEEILREMAPKIKNFLSAPSQEFFDTVINYLNTFDIEYQIDHSLTRPLDYYTQTIFEFREKNTRNKVLVGGRYDGLIKKLGGPDVGGMGFSAGVDRVIALMKQKEIKIPEKDNIQIFVAATGKIAKKEALPILVKLREHGYHAVGVLGKTSIQEQLNRAQSFNVPYMILIGDLEIKKKQVIVRELKTGKQIWIDQEKILSHMDKCLGAPKSLDDTLDFLGHN